MQLKNRWGRKMHMASIKTTLPVLKALGARKTDKHENTLGQQWLSGKECRQARKCSQGWGTGKKTGFSGLDSTHCSRALGNGPLRRKEFACDAAKAVTGWVMCQRHASYIAETSLGAKLPDLRRSERWRTSVSSRPCETSLRCTPKRSVIPALTSMGLLSL